MVTPSADLTVRVGGRGGDGGSRGGGSGFAAAGATGVIMTTGGNPSDTDDGSVIVTWVPGTCAAADVVDLRPNLAG
jgi:hypothetical protein